MGVNAVKNIALSFILMDGQSGNTDCSFDLHYFWKRSITVAVSSELLALHVNAEGGDIFVTSLLQDIGVLVMCQSRPNDYAKLLEEKTTTGFPAVPTERICA